MASRIVDVKPVEGYRLQLQFDDGAQGVVDIRELVPFDGVFAPLEDQAYFRQVRVEPDFGAIYWPDGADLDPDVLHAVVTGKPVPMAPAHSWAPSKIG